MESSVVFGFANDHKNTCVARRSWLCSSTPIDWILNYLMESASSSVAAASSSDGSKDGAEKKPKPSKYKGGTTILILLHFFFVEPFHLMETFSLIIVTFSSTLFSNQISTWNSFPLWEKV